MCTTFNERVKQARSLVPFVGTLKSNNGKPSVLIVPGSNGTRYRVILRRNGRSISAECAKELGNMGHEVCKGNKCTKTLCKHAIAAIEYTIQEGKFSSNWCELQDNAQLIHRMLGGSIFEARSWDGKGTASILVTKEN